QPGASVNTLATGDNAVLKIELSGTSAPGTDGLVISGGGTTVRGLVINGFQEATGFGGGTPIFLLNLGNNANNVIAGNFIGTNAAGTAAVANTRGIDVEAAAPGTTVGGTAPAARNLISGNLGNGIVLASDNNVVQGNEIGTDVTGTLALGNAFSGVSVGGSHNTIGGTGTGAGNAIAFNCIAGVRLDFVPVGVGNSILGNSIFSNVALGIDLNEDGVTANDPGDTDIGPNNLQNFPVLTGATPSGTSTVIRGTLN